MSRSREEYPSHVQRAIDEGLRRERSGTTRIGEELRSAVERSDGATATIGETVILATKDATYKLEIAKASEPEDPYDSQLERDYADHLEKLRLAGEILRWEYAAIRFEIGDAAWYKPDFDVINKESELELHETKGHWREAARVRIKAAAKRFPWLRWRAITREDGVWREEIF